jgi:hypothetical protein
MNPLEKNTAIALALGYTYDDRVMLYDGEEIKFRLWRTPSGGGMERSGPPNYSGDLNAMHEAEETLIKDDPHAYGCYSSNLYEDYENFIHLTAAQRAEAFLKTLNLWQP